jgi:hypothetical protein
MHGVKFQGIALEQAGSVLGKTALRAVDRHAVSYRAHPFDFTSL